MLKRPPVKRQVVFFVSFAPLFQQIGRLEVGDVELDGERVLLEGPRHSKAAAPDGTRMGKGISLSHDELAILKGILEDMEL